MDKLDTELFRVTDHLPRLKSLSLNNSRKKSYSSISTALRYTSNFAIAGLCAIFLTACNPLTKLGGSSGGSSSVESFAQCANGPADLSGQCRNTSALTPGALEAIGTQEALAIALNTFATAQQVSAGSTPNTLNIAWSPYPGTAAGYFVYYGPTTDTANTLASDLAIGTANFDSSAPSISYQPTLDLGMNTGATVCFRIYAYDTARVPYEWHEVQCRVV